MSDKSSIVDSARGWLLRIETQGLSDDEQGDFDSWLAADPLHRIAFAEQRELWTLLGDLEGEFDDLYAQDLAASDAQSTTNNFKLHNDTLNDNAPGLNEVTSSRRSRLVPTAAAMAAILALAVVMFSKDIWIAAVADFATRAGHTQDIRLEDNSRVVLNTGSAIAIEYTPQERRVRLLRGEAFFDVKSDKDRPFRVEARDGLAEAVGTAFAVRDASQSVLVTVTEGQVAIGATTIDPDDSRQTRSHITAGQQVAYKSGGATSAQQEIDASKVLAWRKGKIVFEDVAFSKAIRELNRYVPGRIVVISDTSKAPRISGVFQTSEIDSAIRAVAAVNGLTVARTPGNRLLVLY
ncbi:MAG: FecR domain-containing protein [Pseudomonadota bacterium]